MNPLTPRIAFLMTLPPLLWAGNAIVGRLVVGHVPPVLLNLMRWSLALAILLPLGWRLLATAASRAELGSKWRELLLQGFLGIGCYNVLQYLALQTSTPINVTLIAASSPLWMMGAGALIYRVRPTRRDVVSAALSLLGVLVVLSRGDLTHVAEVRFVPGDLLMLLAVASWSLYSWMLARPPARLTGARRPAWNWAEMLMAQILFGLPWAATMAVTEVVIHPTATVDWSPWLAAGLIYLAIGPSVIAYRFWGLGVATAGPAIAALFSNLTPLFAALLSAALLRELPQGYHMVAFALIVAGIGVSLQRSPGP